MGSIPAWEITLSDLPFHPLIPGLQALGFTDKGKVIWPVMGGSQPLGDPNDPPPVDPPANPQPVDPPGPPDRGFPDNTAVKDMTEGEQAAYWKFHDRRKSDRLKAYGDITAEQAKQYKDAADAAARAQMTPADQALADARAEGATAAAQAAAAQWAPEFAKQVIGQFVTDEEKQDSILAGLDPLKFVKDGKFDTQGLRDHLTGLATAFGGSTDSQEPQPRQWGQQGDLPPAKSASEEGLAEARRRGFIK